MPRTVVLVGSKPPCLARAAGAAAPNAPRARAIRARTTRERRARLLITRTSTGWGGADVDRARLGVTPMEPPLSRFVVAVGWSARHGPRPHRGRSHAQPGRPGGDARLHRSVPDLLQRPDRRRPRPAG